MSDTTVRTVRRTKGPCMSSTFALVCAGRVPRQTERIKVFMPSDDKVGWSKVATCCNCSLCSAGALATLGPSCLSGRGAIRSIRASTKYSCFYSCHLCHLCPVRAKNFPKRGVRSRLVSFRCWASSISSTDGWLAGWRCGALGKDRTELA